MEERKFLCGLEASIDYSFLTFNSVAEVVVCTSHSVAFSKSTALLTHVRSRHGVNSVSIEDIRSSLVKTDPLKELVGRNMERSTHQVADPLAKYPLCLGGKAQPSELALKYRNTPSGMLQKGDMLQKIPSLPTHSARQCFHCSFCAISDSVMIAHFKSSHPTSSEEAKIYLQSCTIVDVQTISLGKAARYFPVYCGLHDSRRGGISDEGEIREAQKDIRPLSGELGYEGNINIHSSQRNDHGAIQVNSPRSREYNAIAASLSKRLLHLHPSASGRCSAGESKVNSETRQRETSLFLKLCGFENILQQIGISSIDDAPIELVSAPEWNQNTENTTYSDTTMQFQIGLHGSLITRHVEHYVRKASMLTDDSAPFLLREVKPSDKRESSKRKFSCLTSSGAFRNYSRTIARLVLFCMRVWDSTNAGEEKVKTINVILCSMKDKYLSQVSSYVKIWSKKLSVARNRNLSDTDRHHVLEGSFSSCDQWTELDVALHLLLRGVLLYRREDTNSAKPFLIRYFIAMISIQKDPKSSARRFASARDISPHLAALQYATSVVALVELRSRDIFANVHALFSSPESELLENDSAPHPSIMEYIAMPRRNVELSLSLSGNTSVSYIRDFLDKSMAILKGETANIRYLACSLHPRCALIDGKELSLNSLGNAARKWMTECTDLISKELFLGMRIDDGFFKTTTTLHDNFMSDIPGFNFMGIQKNVEWFRSQAGLLLQHIQGSDVLSKKWFIIKDSPGSTAPEKLTKSTHSFSDKLNLDGAGKPYIDTSRMAEPSIPSRRPSVAICEDVALGYLKKAQHLQELLLVLSHVVGGGTARATEIATYQCENDSSSTRNVYVQQGEVILISRYNKTQSMTGRDKTIARVMDRDTSKLFFLYFIIIKPFEVMLVAFLHGDTIARSHAKYLFVENGVPHSESRIRACIQSVFSSSGIPFNLIQYRHYQCAMSSRFLSSRYVQLLHDSSGLDEQIPGLEDSDLSLVDVSHQQSGHSAATSSRTYATGAHTIRGMASQQLLNFRNASRAWQSLFLNKISGRVDDDVQDICNMDESIESAENKALKCQELNDVVKRVVENALKNFSEQHSVLGTRKLTNSAVESENVSGQKVTCKYSSSLENKRWKVSWCLRRKNELMDLIRLQPYLQKMRNDTGAKFRSANQMRAVAEALDRKQDIIVVMPTGSGKSDIFLLPSFIEGPDKVTIVVVPLQALIEDLRRRCISMNICVGTWTERDVEGIQVLILAVEHLNLPQYGALLGELCNTGRLSRIVVDEAHLTALWSSFREPLRRLHRTLCPTSVPVQRILLSATIPPSDEQKVARAHGLDQFIVERCSTMRENISYRVKYVEDVRFVTSYATVMKTAIEMVRKELSIIDDRKRREGILSTTPRIMVYCPLRKMVEELFCAAKGLGENKEGVKVFKYHGGMDKGERAEVQESWERGAPPSSDGLFTVYLAICTSAFGTGVHTSGVESVIHVGFARSLLEYVQETGRAGREGGLAKCITVYNRRFAKSQVLASNYYDEVFSTSSMERCAVTTQSPLPDDSGDSIMYEFMTWAEMKTECRRKSLFDRMDGIRHSPCPLVDVEQDTWCDNCLELVENRKSSNDNHSSCPEPSSNDLFDAAIIGTCDTPKSSGNRTTTQHNFETTRRATARSQDILYQTKLMCSRLVGRCMFCLASKNISHENIFSQKMSCVSWKCLRCFQKGHSYNECPVFSSKGLIGRKTEKGSACFACGMNDFCGLDLHERSEYGSPRKCPWFLALQLSMQYLLDLNDEGIQRLGDHIGSENLQLVRNILQCKGKTTPLYEWLTSMDERLGRLNVMSMLAYFDGEGKI